MKPVIRGLIATLAALPMLAHPQSSSGPDNIVLPDGFSIEVYTDEVPNARSLALGDNGTVFVATRSDGRVYAVIPEDAGKPLVVTIASGLKMPNGVAFYKGDLYVAATSTIIRYVNIEDNLNDIPTPEVLTDSLPGEAHHGWRYIAFGPDGKLYVTIGAPCNVCDREGFGNISRLNADGSGLEIFAKGVRNSVGLAWHPETGNLWFTDNGRDMLGDNVPAGELNTAGRDGMHFGFPYCHAGDIADPDFGDQRQCDEFSAPQQKLRAHVAPLGLAFYSGGMFPDEYQGRLFVAEHGSWNRSRKIGYRIGVVSIVNGKAEHYETFAEGWLQGDEVSGRPVDLLVIADGSMLVSDDKEGRLYRISYSQPAAGNDAPWRWTLMSSGSVDSEQ